MSDLRRWGKASWSATPHRVNAGFSGGNGVFVAGVEHDAEALAHAANNAIWEQDVGAARIIPGFGDFFDQVYCSDTVFGIWWYLQGTDRQALADSEAQIWVDGEELEITEGAVKRMVNPQGVLDEFLQGLEWWRSMGVPVFGALEPGSYLVESVVHWADGEVFSDYAHVIVLDAASDPECTSG